MASTQLQRMAQHGVGQPRLRAAAGQLLAPGPLVAAVAAVATPSAILAYSSWGGPITGELIGDWVMISLGALTATGALVLMLPRLFGLHPAAADPATPASLPVDAERLQHLQVLGLDGAADEDAIQRSYRTLARACHPDLHQDNVVEAEAQFKRLNAARSALLG